jgi:hypothetical protein
MRAATQSIDMIYNEAGTASTCSMMTATALGGCALFGSDVKSSVSESITYMCIDMYVRMHIHGRYGEGLFGVY